MEKINNKTPESFINIPEGDINDFSNIEIEKIAVENNVSVAELKRAWSKARIARVVDLVKERTQPKLPFFTGNPAYEKLKIVLDSFDLDEEWSYAASTKYRGINDYIINMKNYLNQGIDLEEAKSKAKEGYLDYLRGLNNYVTQQIVMKKFQAVNLLIVAILESSILKNNLNNYLNNNISEEDLSNFKKSFNNINLAAMNFSTYRGSISMNILLAKKMIKVGAYRRSARNVLESIDSYSGLDTPRGYLGYKPRNSSRKKLDNGRNYEDDN